MRCPRCRHENRATAKYCEQCGVELARRCTACGAENAPEARFCAECGQGVGGAHQGAPAPAGPPVPADGRGVGREQTRLVSILFADLAGSVEVTEGLDPEETSELLDSVLAVMGDAVRRHGGRVNNVLGDGVLAVFGVPHAHEEDPERAIRAALDIRDGLHGLALAGTAGISTGETFLGPADDHGEPAIRGRFVNLAARLQASAAPGQVLVSEVTHRLTRRSFRFAAHRLDVKGVADPVRAFEVLAAAPRPEKPRGIEGIRARLHGRQTELATLTGALARLRGGEGGIATIIGEAGVGKSRLVLELRRAAAAGSDAPEWLEGRCLETGTGTGYMPFRTLLAEHFALGPADDGSERAARVAAGVGDLAARGAITPERAAEATPPLQRLLGVPVDEASARRLEALGPEQLRNETFTAVRDVLAASAAARPIVLILEDLHWADALSFELGTFLFESTRRSALLVIGVLRPEPEHRWRRFTELAEESRSDAPEELWLGELPPDVSRSLLEDLIAAEVLPGATRDLILERTQGNPFFLEEVVQSLIDSGALRLGDGGWRSAGAIDPVLVPESVQAVILSRVDRLTGDEQRVLQAAAVTGRTFPRRLLARLWSGDDALERSLWELERRGLIVKEQSLPEEAYSFRHVLAQETVYRSLVRRERRQLHQQVAQAIEDAYASSLEAHYEALAHHYERGIDTGKAVDYLLRAADKSRAAFLNDAAADAYRRALRLLGEAPEGAVAAEWRSERSRAANEHLADVLQLSGRQDEALAAYARALELTPPGGAVASARVHRRIGKSFQLRHRADEAFAELDEAEACLAAADVTGDPADVWSERIEIALDRVLLAYFVAPPAVLDSLVARATELVDTHGSPAQRAKSLHLRALATLRRDRYRADQATVDLAREAAEASELITPADVGMTRFIHGFSLLWAGRFDEAELELSTTLDRAERTGDLTLQARCVSYLAIVARRRGDVDRVIDRSGRGLAIAERGDMVEYVAQANANLSWAARRQGDELAFRERALHAWRLWQTLPRHGPYLPLGWIARWPMLALLLEDGRVADALEHAAALAEHQPLPGDVLGALGRALAAQRAEFALEHLRRACALAERSGDL